MIAKRLRAEEAQPAVVTADSKGQLAGTVSEIDASPRQIAQRRAIDAAFGSQGTAQGCTIGPPVAQLTGKDAETYTPARAKACNDDFRLHHTTRGQPMSDAIARENHETRANEGLNTTIDITPTELQEEIRWFLEDLATGKAQQLGARVELVTLEEYDCIVTAWNDGNPVVSYRQRGKLRLVASWVNDQYLRVHHFDAIE